MNPEARERLRHIVPVVRDARGAYVAIATVPRPHRDALLDLVQREMVPIFHQSPVGDCLYPWDWFAWLDDALYCPF
ncbi:hypothetical protein [Cupriavidus sp. EM10]|uniref:hypothetical protein n=1 Tax=Cupriavidus sp. EM10 TaxID=2839983 RepID=UPI001C007F8C|nr:hypothetical protein [Cupriavidus sp. EM10]QWE98146.1 hypothetical protein KLP38_28500 [Cupriavidus sp. EM10]